MFPSAFALIGDIGGPELLLIFVLVLLLFGGKSLPDFARGLARSIREFKKATSGVEEEIKRAMEEPPPPRRPLPAPPPPPAFDHGGQPAAHDSYHDYHHDYHSGDHPAGPSGHEIDRSPPPSSAAAPSEPAAPTPTVTETSPALPSASSPESGGASVSTATPASTGDASSGTSPTGP
jgi:sec-independent protein translocase protein TatA